MEEEEAVIRLEETPNIKRLVKSFFITLVKIVTFPAQWFAPHSSVKALAFSIENDPSWIQRECRLINASTGGALWIANGVLYLDHHPNISAFSLVEKIYLWSAIRNRLAKNATLKKGE